MDRQKISRLIGRNWWNGVGGTGISTGSGRRQPPLYVGQFCRLLSAGLLLQNTLLKGSLLLVAFLTLLLPSAARAYIEFPYAATFQTIRMPHLPRGGEPWKENQWELMLSAGWMNVWSIQSDRFIMDGEELTFNAAISYGITDRVRMGVVFPYVVQGGGIMDSSIERFHSVLGVTQGQRDRFPRNRLNVSYEPLGEIYPFLMRLERFLEAKYLPRAYPRNPLDPPIDLQLEPESLYLAGIDPARIPEDTMGGSNRSGPGQVRFYIDYGIPVSYGSGFASVEGAVVSLQAARQSSSSLIGGGTGNSASVSLAFFSPRAPNNAYWVMGVSYSAFERSEFRLLELPAQQWSIRPRIGYDLDGVDLFMEYVFFTSPVKDFGKLSADAHQIGLGLGTDVGAYRLEVAIIENFLTYSTTPDVGMHLALRRTL